MKKEGPKFYVRDASVGVVPESDDNSQRNFEGRVVVQDTSEVVDAYGTLKELFKTYRDQDPFQAVHGAIQEAARAIDPNAPGAALLETNAFPTVPKKGYRAEAQFQVGDSVVRGEGFHPSSREAAKLNAIVRGNQSLYTS